MPEPVKDIYELLRDNWDDSQVPALSSPPEFSTGKWGSEHTFPAVVVHSQDEGVLNGGETGYTAFGSDGVGMQIRQGTVMVECVAGRRSDVSENPKKVRQQMQSHIFSLLFDFSAWPDGYRNLSPGDARDMEITSDEEDPEPIYSKQIDCSYLYDTS